MFKHVLNQIQIGWVSENSGTLLKILLILLVVIASLINPDIVLADAVMGGSVG